MSIPQEGSVPGRVLAYNAHKRFFAKFHVTELVEKINQLIIKSEYKRRQAPPGVKITTLAFGRDRRYPITNHYKK